MEYEQHIRKKTEIYIGLAAEDAFKKGSLDETGTNTFFNICCSFYIELIKQIMKRFNIYDPTWIIASMMDPRSLNQLTDFKQVTNHFTSFTFGDGDAQQLKNEFLKIRMLILRGEISLNDKDGVENCWR